MTEASPGGGVAAAATRHILHVDMDAFFVSVELLDQPELAGRPVVVGGSGRRGVIAAASYEARHFGVRSAMPSSTARRLCPEAIFIDGRHERYRAVSKQVFKVFESITPLVEGLSLDEAFLDISGATTALGSPESIAHQVRERVHEQIGLWCSVGLAPNKFLAKLASVQAKPKSSPTGPIPGSGVVVVSPDAIAQFLEPLPVRALWGVGKVTGAKLERLGIDTVAALGALSRSELCGYLGQGTGSHLYDLARGYDVRPVEVGGDMKSVSQEETFPYDVSDISELEKKVVSMADTVGSRLRKADLAGRTVMLKVRYGDFRTISRAKTLSSATDDGKLIAGTAKGLLATLDVAEGIRLVGVGVSKLATSESQQLSMFDSVDDSGERHVINSTVDAIRDRFGGNAIGLAGMVNKDRGAT